MLDSKKTYQLDSKTEKVPFAVS